MPTYSEKHLEKLDCKYGAPLGRPTVVKRTDVKVRLFHVEMYDGCYDAGGAYWGMGVPIYCAKDDEGNFTAFVRERSREAAKAYFAKAFPKLSFFR